MDDVDFSAWYETEHPRVLGVLCALSGELDSAPRSNGRLGLGLDGRVAAAIFDSIRLDTSVVPAGTRTSAP
jgi:hypothetical protein